MVTTTQTRLALDLATLFTKSGLEYEALLTIVADVMSWYHDTTVTTIPVEPFLQEPHHQDTPIMPPKPYSSGNETCPICGRNGWKGRLLLGKHMQVKHKTTLRKYEAEHGKEKAR